MPVIKNVDRRSLIRKEPSWNLKGRVKEVVGTVIEASVKNVKLGSIVDICSEDERIKAEVVGFRDDRTLLIPFSNCSGISTDSVVEVKDVVDKIRVSEDLLGKVVDPFLRVLNDEISGGNFDDQIDKKLEQSTLDSSYFNSYHDSYFSEELISIDNTPPNPIKRERINSYISMGIKAIDSAITIGNGQRIGIMAGSGVGKSVLLGMIAKGSNADVNVIGLIGERGREVREFIERDLGPEGLARSVVVVSTGDESPLMKVRASKVVSSIAEYFSSHGKNVVLMMDSLTRVAMAQREIGLAVGEPPTTKGYTPSVFAMIPKLLERSGTQLPGHGAITGLYTVLVDGDDFNEPIADAARSVLDGHIVLSRRLANRGQYPAIDVTASVSRVMNDIVDDHHLKLARKLKELISVYEENKDLVQIGAYQLGTNPVLDEAIKLQPKINKFLSQGINERVSLTDTVDLMDKLFLTSTEELLEDPEV